jgi:hypothetical protein
MREAEVRAALAGVLERQHPAGATRLIHELDLCQAEARIDLAVVNGSMIGWEIKTASDTLARLPRQQEVYSKVFDRVWLAAAPRHVERALEQVPAWWGVAEVVEHADGYRFRVLRTSRRNWDVDLHALVRLLWRAEALDELKALGLSDGLERAPRRVLWAALADAAPRQVSKTDLRGRVRWRLRTRRGWRSDVPRM